MTQVTLDGTGSYDPDPGQTETLRFLWTAPNGITLDDVHSKTPSFNIPGITETTTYTFSLVVTDIFGLDSQPSYVSVTIIPPTGDNINVTLIPNIIVTSLGVLDITIDVIYPLTSNLLNAFKGTLVVSTGSGPNVIIASKFDVWYGQIDGSFTHVSTPTYQLNTFRHPEAQGPGVAKNGNVIVVSGYNGGTEISGPYPVSTPTFNYLSNTYANYVITIYSEDAGVTWNMVEAKDYDPTIWGDHTLLNYGWTYDGAGPLIWKGTTTAPGFLVMGNEVDDIAISNNTSLSTSLWSQSRPYTGGNFAIGLLYSNGTIYYYDQNDVYSSTDGLNYTHVISASSLGLGFITAAYIRSFQLWLLGPLSGTGLGLYANNSSGTILTPSNMTGKTSVDTAACNAAVSIGTRIVLSGFQASNDASLTLPTFPGQWARLYVATPSSSIIASPASIDESDGGHFFVHSLSASSTYCLASGTYQHSDLSTYEARAYYSPDGINWNKVNITTTNEYFSFCNMEN